MKIVKKSQQVNLDKLIAACRQAKLSDIETAALCGNAYVETYFTHYRENTNYSEAGLLRVWPRLFRMNKPAALALANRPEAIANYVYANKLGNRGAETGDGWAYRGLGALQITGATTFSNVHKMHKLMASTGLTKAPYPVSTRLYSVALHAEVTAVAYWLAYVRQHWSTPLIIPLTDEGLKAVCLKINKAGLQLEARIAAIRVCLNLLNNK